MTTSQAQAPFALVADQVTKRFGEAVALDRVSLAIERGECMALVGESGSGKTTLLRCFNRMIAPDDGRILVDGADTRALDPVSLRRRIGYVPQDGGLLPHWSVERNAALVPWLRDMTDPLARGRSALALVGIEELAARAPHELSGGQRQRVAIARALAASPDLLLLDEPFGALDAITRGELQQSFADLRRNVFVSSVLVTHDLREAIMLADRIAVMRRGRLEQIGTADDCIDRPATDYVASLLERAGIQ
ncbi:MAG TPA: ATP-binding cassette domain-containing protein [Gemmatimonadaceae bacterium]|nr:ATP-binding cassette domain-containing protein [Gemmatimonadaceae bacterium]